MHYMLEKSTNENGYLIRGMDNSLVAEGKTMPDLVFNLKKYVAENRDIGVYYGNPARKDIPEQVSSAEIENFRSLYFS